jgi:hypothetical protein
VRPRCAYLDDVNLEAPDTAGKPLMLSEVVRKQLASDVHDQPGFAFPDAAAFSPAEKHTNDTFATGESSGESL